MRRLRGLAFVLVAMTSGGRAAAATHTRTGAKDRGADEVSTARAVAELLTPEALLRLIRGPR